MKIAFSVMVIALAFLSIAFIVEYFADDWFRFNICIKNTEYTYKILDIIKIISSSVAILSFAIFMIKLCFVAATDVITGL